MRTASDERSAQSEIYETSDNIAKRLDDRPDRLVFPIYRKYLIPNKPGQTKPKPTEQAASQQRWAKHWEGQGKAWQRRAAQGEGQGSRQGRAEYLAKPTSQSASGVQCKYAAAEANCLPVCLLVCLFVCSFVIQSVRRLVRSSVRQPAMEPEVHPMFGVLLALLCWALWWYAKTFYLGGLRGTGAVVVVATGGWGLTAAAAGLG